MLEEAVDVGLRGEQLSGVVDAGHSGLRGSILRVARLRRSARAGGAMPVDRRAVALIESLEEPGRLGGEAADDLLAAAAGLVLDGVLEIESDGRFASGPAAHAILFGDGAAAPSGRLAGLSVDALRYGEALPLTCARTLARRLHGYNHIPLHPRWRSRFGDGAQLEQALGLDARDRLAALIDTDYE